jgi:hypothetical protein
MLSLLAAALAFAAFYLLPSLLSSLLSLAIPPEAASEVASSLIYPVLPFVGLLIAVLVFLVILTRGTKIYGPVLILYGFSSIAYIYLALHAGTIQLAIPASTFAETSANVTVNLTALLLILLVTPILTVLKGLLVTLQRRAA